MSAKNTLNEDESLLSFPCHLTVKAMGRAMEKSGVDLQQTVLEIVRQHVAEIAEDAVTTRPSRNGNYLSVSVVVHAHSREQMDAIYQALSDCEHVLMAL